MLHPFLQQKLPQLLPLFKQHQVSRAYAFGSVCTDKFNDSSDVDLLIGFDGKFDPADKGEIIWNMWDELEKVLNRKVDLVTENSLSNPYFIQELNEKKVLLYGQGS
jgi:hypothetical protein